MVPLTNVLTMQATITNAGGASATVNARIEELRWTNCTFPTTTVAKGGLEFHQIGTSTEASVTANAEIAWTGKTVLFESCIYGFNAGSNLGIVRTASSGAATFNTNGVPTKRSGNSFLCPETTRWVRADTGTEPANLRVESS